MNITELLSRINSNALDYSLERAYPASQLATAKTRSGNLLNTFQATFGNMEQSLIASASGRTEIGGNHTDHNGGQVLAAAVNLDLLAVAAPVETKIVTLHSQGFAPIVVDLSSLEPAKSEFGTSEALIRGTAAAFVKRGQHIGGFNACVTSQVPKGSGISSSAAFEVLLCTLFSNLFNDGKLDPIDSAIMSQQAENIFFGKPCGLMDQMASSVGGFITIDFKDSTKPIVKRVAFDFANSGYSLCIVDTKGSHHDLTPEYAAIPTEMRSAAACVGADILGHTTREEIVGNASLIRERCGDRALLRALHFFDENQRVELQAQALGENNFADFLRLIKESGKSSLAYLQNVFPISDPQHQGVSLGLYLSENFLREQGACRVHGGGFAGTIQAFVPSSMVKDYQLLMDNTFGAGNCHLLSVRTVGGIKF